MQIQDGKVVAPVRTAMKKATEKGADPRSSRTSWRKSFYKFIEKGSYARWKANKPCPCRDPFNCY